jgi:hypothetical protein
VSAAEAVVVEKKKKERDGKKRSDTVSINRHHSKSPSPFTSATQVDIIFFYTHTTAHLNI